MRVAVSKSDLARALAALRAELDRSMGRPKKNLWSFPAGGKGPLPTWFSQTRSGPLAVALGGQNYWGSRTPFLLACAEAPHGITPTVEVNIPQGSGAPDRSVNGCVCVDERGRFILVHRGSSFTVTPWKVPKKAVHRHFSKWLQVVEDGDRQASVIPIGPIGRGLVEQMALFAQMVLQLKRAWATNQGQAPAVSRVSGWRDDLNFPGKI